MPSEGTRDGCETCRWRQGVRQSRRELPSPVAYPDCNDSCSAPPLLSVAMDQPASLPLPTVESRTAPNAPLPDSHDAPLSTSEDQQQHNQSDVQQSHLKRSKTSYIVSPPRYVRTQTLGLQRSNTAATLSHVKPAIVLPPTPRTPVDVEDGLASQQQQGGDESVQKTNPVKRRVSVGFPQLAAGAAGPAKTAELPRQRPLKRRSDSLPTIPGVTDDVQPLSSSGTGSANDVQSAGAAASVSATRKSMIFQPGSHADVSSLPTDPKTWNSRQLAVYLAHVLKLQPSAIRADVQRLVVKSGLTGKRFLRMQHDDLLGLGINIACECGCLASYIAHQTDSLLSCARVSHLCDSSRSPEKGVPARQDLRDLLAHALGDQRDVPERDASRRRTRPSLLFLAPARPATR